MKNSFQVIIVGGGPGGLTAGRYLEDSLILEQKKEIGKPVQCAEGISLPSLKKEGIEPNPDWISTAIDTLEIVAPSGKKIIIKNKDAGFVIDRPKFEKSLAQMVKGEIRLEERVVEIKKVLGKWQVKTSKGNTFESNYLIGADGPLSLVRRKVFQEETNLLPTLEYYLETEKSFPLTTMRFYFDREKFPSGYAWIFPKSEKTANIGLGGEKNLKERFDYLMSLVEKEFGHYKLLENKSGTISWGGMLLKLSKDNAFLVGDAGGLTDPVLGGGIINAITSGRVAAQCIKEGKAEEYDLRIKKLPQFRKELLEAQKILYAMENPLLDEIAMAFGGKAIHQLDGKTLLLKALFFPHLRKNIFKVLRLFSILKGGGVSA